MTQTGLLLPTVGPCTRVWRCLSPPSTPASGGRGRHHGGRLPCGEGEVSPSQPESEEAFQVVARARPRTDPGHLANASGILSCRSSRLWAFELPY